MAALEFIERFVFIRFESWFVPGSSELLVLLVANADLPHLPVINCNDGGNNAEGNACCQSA